MKIPALFFRVCAILSLCLVVDSAAVIEPAMTLAQTEIVVATNAAAEATPVPVVVPELAELRNQLRMMERSNEEMQRATEQASKNFESMSQQNASLSNVLSGLQQTLITQREREVELNKQSASFNSKIIAGAAAAVFLVFAFSYWFQLRCLNRVMEFSKAAPALHAHEPALLEQGNPQTSKLLSAMKMLEHRMEQLESPAHANGNFSESNVTMLNGGEAAPSSSMSLLLAKGQVLLDTERLQEAVACFQEAITVDPANAEAHLKKGIALERMNRLEPALAAYEEALRLNPKRAVANVYKARVLAALHRYDEAISVYDSALGRNSGKVETPIFAS